MTSQPAAPITAAFLYPWFPAGWNQGGQIPFTHYTPTLGLYSSSDTAVVDRQIALATNAGLEAFIASWWGPGHRTDAATRAILDRIPASPNPDLRLAVYYEQEGQGDPTPAAIAEDLTYLEGMFSQPGYLRVNGKPVVFVWADPSDGAGMAERWAQAKAVYGGDVYVVLKVYQGFAADPNQPDSWHQYGPATPYSEHLPWSSVVSPGFWHAEEATPRLARNVDRFRSDVQRMVSSGAQWQLVTSWNEWGEGTSVEPAEEYGTSYLDVLGEALGGGSAPDTSTPAPSPAPSPPADEITFAAGGDWGATSATSATLASIAAGDAQFLLALGDLSYGDTTASGWCDFVKQRLGSTFPVELLVGNHEDDDRVDNFILDFAACLPDRMGAIGTYAAEYYFDVGNLARFIMIGAGNDVDGVKYDYVAGNTHYRWLESTIDAARSQGIPWVIVGAHKPCLTAGVKSCEVGADLYNLLLSKRVDLILHGHEHNYQRSKQLTCATPGVFRPECVADDGADGVYSKGAGAVFAIEGASGGGGLYAVSTSDPDYPYLAAAMGKNSSDVGRGYVQVSITRDRLALDHINTTGTFRDHFVIETVPGSVNRAPVAGAVSLVTAEDVPVGWSPVVSDPDGGSLSCAVVSGPAAGSASVAADCSAGTYRPEADRFGSDAFTYSVSDGALTATATVSVSVTPVNDAPVAAAQVVGVAAGGSVEVGLLGSDVDLDAGLTFAVRTAPVHGSLGAVGAPVCTAGSCRASVVYTPAAGFSGADSFEYTVADSSGAVSAPATVSVNVSSASSATTSVPVADAYVTASSPGSNYGSSDQLRTDGSPEIRSYLRFDVAGVSGNVSSATLRVYAGSSLSAGFAVARVPATAWDERSITYANAPVPGTPIGVSGPVTSGRYVDVDVTDLVTGDGEYTLAITPLSSTNLRLGSRETSTPPQLRIEAVPAS